LSLNPAIDVTLWTETLKPDEDNIVEDEQYDAAGKAMNVSRALRYYGVDNLALVLAGCHNLHRYEQRLREEKINYRLITVEGYIRENISIVQPDRSVTRLMRQGFCVEYETVDEIKEQLSQVVEEGSLVVISGKLPRGISPTVLKMICNHISSLGGRVSLDTTTLTLADIYEIKPWIIKPNYAEACQLAGKELNSHEALVAFGAEVNANGIDHCLISLGHEGLLHTGNGGATRVLVPAVDVISSVGAGDCTLAGFIMSVQQEMSLERCLSVAAAFGTAACLTEGTNPPPKLATANILQQLKVKKIST
ncbi:MAG: hexose kinase, partial [Angelakisella sp.]